MRKVCRIMIVIGVLLFVLGAGMKHETGVGTYHEAYKDYSGTWRGRDVSYLSEKTNGFEMIGMVIAVAGGIGLSVTKKSDK